MPCLSRILMILVCAMLIGWQQTAAYAKQALTPAQAQAVNVQIRDYLLAHPEVVVQALQIVQDREDAQQKKQARNALGNHQDELLHDPSSPVIGNPNGNVTLVEFFDYQCPYCKASAPALSDLVRQDPHLRVVMKEFPVLGPDSVFASRIALIAARYGKYGAFHDAMLALKGKLDHDRTLEIARSVGLDTTGIETQATDPAIDTIIQANLDLAHTLSIDGTPTFVIGNTIIPGQADIDDLKQAVAAARQKG